MMGFMGLGVWEVLIFLLVVVLLFGSTRLPTLARSFGQSIIEFKKGLKELGVSSDDDKSEP